MRFNEVTCPSSGYVPFTYLVRCLTTGGVYYGSKYSMREGHVAHPSMMWLTYFTSSSFKKHAKENPESYQYEIRQVFETAEEAVQWETRLLKKVDAKRNPLFINKHNGDGKAFMVGERSVEDVNKMRGARGPQKNPCRVKSKHQRPRSTEYLNKKSKRFWIMTPDGVRHEGINLAKFCRDNGFSFTQLSRICNKGIQVFRGKSRYEGWLGGYVNEEATKN